MLVKYWMSKPVITVDVNDSMQNAIKLLKQHDIGMLPVMKKDKLVGLVTKHMLLEASPLPATTLSIHELHYLLAKMTVKEIMVKKPYTISPNMPPEEALQLGQEMGYGAFPVMEDGRLVGIVTESDIVRLMTKVLGVEEKGKRIDVKISKEFGNMQKVMRILDKKKGILLSYFTCQRPDEGDYPTVLSWATVLPRRSPKISDLRALR